MSEWIKGLSSLEEIAQHFDWDREQGQGYYWLSDQTTAYGLHSLSELEGTDTAYVVEALARQGDQALHVRHVGDGYAITVYDLSALPQGVDRKERTYLGHRLPGEHSEITFEEVWTAEPDDNCLDMPVKQLQAIVFTSYQ